MSKIHVLQQSSATVFDCVAHFAMPTGNNSVSVPWKTCYLAATTMGGSYSGTPNDAKQPTSVMPSSGNNNPAPGKIGNAELSQINSGDVIEIRFQAGIEAADVADPNPKLNLFADRAIAAFKAGFDEAYKYYGYTVA